MASTNKRKYIAPGLNAIRIDQEISLVMMTQPGGNPPGSPVVPKAPGAGTEKSTPFGGNTPDYSKM